MPQLYLRASDLNGGGYDGDDLPFPPDIAIVTNYGSVNATQSRMTFRVNLENVIGYAEYRKKDRFNIQLVDVKTVNVLGGDVIDCDSPACLRVSNAMVSGLQSLNGQSKNCMGIVSNFIPNLEQPYNVFYARADLASYTLRLNHFNTTFAGRVCELGDLYNSFLLPRGGNPAWLQAQRFRFNGDVPELDGKIFRITGYTVINTQVLDITVVGAGDGSLPEFAPVNGKNVTFTPVPDEESWFMLSRDPSLPSDSAYGIDLTFLKPVSPEVEICIELTDLLTGGLQPVIAEPSGKVFPSFVFVFEVN